jgi:hypothetical protein
MPYKNKKQAVAVMLNTKKGTKANKHAKQQLRKKKTK